MYKYQTITSEQHMCDALEQLHTFNGDDKELTAIAIVDFADTFFPDDSDFTEFIDETNGYLEPVLGRRLEHYTELKFKFEDNGGFSATALKKIFGDNIVHSSTLDEDEHQLHCSTSANGDENTHCSTSLSTKPKLENTASDTDFIGSDVLQCNHEDVLQLNVLENIEEKMVPKVLNSSTPAPPLGSTRATASGLATQRKKKVSSPNVLSGVDVSCSTFLHLNTRGDTSRFNIDEIRLQIWYNGKKERVAEYSGKVSYIRHATKTKGETCRDQYFDFTNRVKFRRNCNQARLKKDRASEKGLVPQGKRIIDNDWFVEINDYLLEQNRNRKKFGAEEALVSFSQKKEYKNRKLMWVHRQCQSGSEEVAVLHKGTNDPLDVQCVELFFGPYKITFGNFTINRSPDVASAALDKRWYKRDFRAEIEKSNQ